MTVSVLRLSAIDCRSAMIRILRDSFGDAGVAGLLRTALELLPPRVDRARHLARGSLDQPDELRRRRVDEGEQLRPKLRKAGERRELLDLLGVVGLVRFAHRRDEPQLRVVLRELGDRLGEADRVAWMGREPAGALQTVGDLPHRGPLGPAPREAVLEDLVGPSGRADL